MNTVLFYSHLLAIVIEQIHVIVIAIVSSSKSKQSGQNHTKLRYIPSLIRTERIKPMPCPAAHPGTTSSLRWSRKREAREKRPGDEVDPRINRQRAFSIINRAPKGTCVYSDNKDYTAAINDSTMDVELQRKFSFDYRGVTVVKFVPLDKVIFNASFSFKPSFLAFFLLASYLSTLQKLCLDSQSQEKGQFPCLAH